MYRPNGACKLCDRVFETEFTSKSAEDHYYSRADKVISSKFMPCLHTICCVECSKREKYMECPFCENQIKKVVCYSPIVINYDGRWEFKILYSNFEWNSKWYRNSWNTFHLLFHQCFCTRPISVEILLICLHTKILYPNVNRISILSSL